MQPGYNGMKLNHFGAKNGVTGSCHLIQTHMGVNILVDCGKACGDDPELSFERFPVSPREMDYLFLTHAHIDHIGRVPDLIDAGFDGEIICTHATKALLLPMLRVVRSLLRITMNSRCGGWRVPLMSCPGALSIRRYFT
jgi:Cft2 family RNA processing exonuclease